MQAPDPRQPVGTPRRPLQRAAMGVAGLSLAATVGAAAYTSWADRRASRVTSSAHVVLPDPEGSRQTVWYYGKTPAEVDALLGSDNRLVSIAIAHAAPLRLDVAMVANTGARKMSWWWLPGTGAEVTSGQVGGFAGSHEARLVSLAPYVVDGTTYFAAIYVANGISDDKAWWWYFDTPAANVDGLLASHNARPIDLRSYGAIKRLYAVVMVAKPQVAEGMWWYMAVDRATIRARLADGHAQLTSLSPADPGMSTFDVIMSAAPAGPMPAYDNVSWAWATGDTD
jgi:hypothetical protein